MDHVLLVEDNPLDRALVEDIFRYGNLPGELVCVGSAEEAIEDEELRNLVYQTVGQSHEHDPAD